jgi:hypothetical protein
MIAVNLFLDPLSIRPGEVFWFVLKLNQLFPEKFRARWNNICSDIERKKEESDSKGV